MLSELQKAAKDGDGDELAVMRRERKRRLESRAGLPRRRAAGARRRRGERGRVIEAYLPAELSDDELGEIVVGRGRRDRAELAAGHGRGDEGRDGEGGGRADGRRVRALVQEAAARLMRRTIELSNEAAAALAGTGDAILRQLEQHVDCELFLRGNVVTLDGDGEAVARRDRGRASWPSSIEQGHEIGAGTIAAVTGALDRHASPAEILEDVVWRHRARSVAPKTVNQKRYVDSIRRNTVTFGIGPAGTGKTFLAVAMAAAALSRREVNRIILTRPAVEAGERLGFLPGDLMAKIDPYLRPLFDALNDMLDPEKVARTWRSGVIEVAPLAFMRGRTLNDSFVILDEAQNTSPSR